jgi:hypothetical protein
LTELDLGQALLAAGHEVGEAGAPPAAAVLGHALDRFESDAELLGAGGAPSVLGFAAEDDVGSPPLEVFRSRLDATIGSIVTRTIGVATEAGRGLTSIPAATVQPWLTGAVNALGSFPQVGPIIKAALRAVRRAVIALRQLVPEAMRKELRELIERWWGDRGDRALEIAARGLLAVSEVESAAAGVLTRRLADARLRGATFKLVKLSVRHERTTEIMNRILRTLSSLLGPLAQTFAAAAAWLYGAAALGCLSAVGAAVWIGQDSLDTGGVWERIPGVRTILSEVVT